MSRFTPLLLLASALLGGCNLLAFPLYVFAPPEKEVTIAPEYAGLADSTVAVVVYADMDTMYEYPRVREDLSQVVAVMLRRNVENVTVIDPGRVVRYQDDTIDWESLPIQSVGRRLGADKVLYISLGEYSMREAGSISLARGRIRAHVSVYDCTLEPGVDPVQWRQRNVTVLFPEEGPAGIAGQNDRNLQIQTHVLFAEKVARYFYEHKLPASEVEAE